MVWALEIPGRLTGIELTEGCGGEDKREEDQSEYEEPHHCWQIRENNTIETAAGRYRQRERDLRQNWLPGVSTCHRLSSIKPERGKYFV